MTKKRARISPKQSTAATTTIEAGGSNEHITAGLKNPEESIQCVLKRPPRHYLLKVESFSLLKSKLSTASNRDYFESSEFTVAGYKWVMSIYPNGNRNIDVAASGHISVDLKMIEHKLALGDFVNVMLRFFIYDHIRHNYYVNQVEKCFETTKTECGISKLVTQDAFHDPSNGFLMNDCCAFGIEIFVLDSSTRFGTLSLMHKPEMPTFTWKIYDFSALGDRLCSPTFTTEGCSWKLDLRPKGWGDSRGKCLFLFLVVSNKDGVGKKAFVEYEISLKNHLQDEDSKRTLTADRFSFPTSHRAWASSLTLTELNDPSKGFKVDDVVILEVTIISVFMLKES